jgi:hypothetical protein
MSALKDAAKTLAGGAKSLVKEAMTTVTKNGWTLVAKKIGFELGKKVGTEIANQLVSIGVDKALVPLIESAIISLVSPKIIESLQKNAQVQKWLELDAKNSNAHYQSMMLKLANEIMNSENSKAAYRKIAEGIADRVLSQNATVGKIYKLMKDGKNFVEIVAFTDVFLMKFEKKIAEEGKIDEETENETVESEF